MHKYLRKEITSTYRTLTQQHNHILQSKQLQDPPLFQVKDTLCKSQSSLKGPLYPGHGRTWDCLCSLSTPEVSPKFNECICEIMLLTPPPPQSVLSGQPIRMYRRKMETLSTQLVTISFYLMLRDGSEELSPCMWSL